MNDAINVATDTPEIGQQTDALVQQVLEEAGLAGFGSSNGNIGNHQGNSAAAGPAAV
jgi:hypothetical protein